MRTFVLINLGCGTYWWELEDGVLYNKYGGQYTSMDKSWILETVEAEDWKDLDYTKTDICQPEAKSGWLAPDGTFYGCGPRFHDDWARMILKKEPGALENEGWVRIYSEVIDDWVCFTKPTKAQVDFLRKNGWVNKKVYDWEPITPALSRPTKEVYGRPQGGD